MKKPLKFSDFKHSELAGRQVLCVLYSSRISGLKNSSSPDPVRSGLSFHWSVKTIKKTTPNIFTVNGSHSMYDHDGHEKQTVSATMHSVSSLCILLTNTEASEFKRRWQWFKENSSVRKTLDDVAKSMKGKPVEEIAKAFHQKFMNPQPFKSKVDMNLIEAKVEAAAASRMWGRDVYITLKEDHPDRPMGSKSYEGEGDYAHVLDTAPPKFVTMYRHGAENGEGINVGQTKMTTKQPKLGLTVYSTAEDGSVVKTVASKPEKPKGERTKTPAVLEKVSYKSIADASLATQTSLAIISGKTWVVAIQSGWGLKRTLVDQCEAGLILVIKGQGFYTYDKKMWKEFDGIFSSRSYTEGGSYVQSKLPAKFEKYFTKFK